MTEPRLHRWGRIGLSDRLGRLSRVFKVGEYQVEVRALGRHADDSLVTTVEWDPAPPERLTPAMCEAFDRGRRQALLELQAEVERILNP